MNTTESTDQLARILCGAQLPALPQSAIRLLELSQNPHNASQQFAVPIESDPGLTGQVLKFVNSSYFGFANEISSVKLAISLVGIRTIKNFALWSAVFSLVPNPRCGPIDLKSLWQDSLRRAIFARRFGRLLGLRDAEELFAAALLQDMAIPVLAKELPVEYQSLLELRQNGQVSLSALEQARFGWNHAIAGAIIARRWHLPSTCADLIANHISLEQYLAHPDPPRESLAVSLSALLPAGVDAEWLERERFQAAYEATVPATAPSLVEFFDAVDREFVDFAPVLKLATPAKPLVDWCSPIPAMA